MPRRGVGGVGGGGATCELSRPCAPSAHQGLRNLSPCMVAQQRRCLLPASHAAVSAWQNWERSGEHTALQRVVPASSTPQFECQAVQAVNGRMQFSGAVSAGRSRHQQLQGACGDLFGNWCIRSATFSLPKSVSGPPRAELPASLAPSMPAIYSLWIVGRNGGLLYSRVSVDQLPGATHLALCLCWHSDAPNWPCRTSCKCRRSSSTTSCGWPAAGERAAGGASSEAGDSLLHSNVCSLLAASVVRNLHPSANVGLACVASQRSYRRCPIAAASRWVDRWCGRVCV